MRLSVDSGRINIGGKGSERELERRRERERVSERERRGKTYRVHQA